MLKFMMRVALIVAAVVCFAPTAKSQDDDDAYIKRFYERYPKVEAPPALSAYANADRFDERFLGDALDDALKGVKKNQGNNAWGLAYWMHAFNEMYRATKDEKYLDANLRCIDAMLAARDDKQGLKLWTGVIAPAWSSDKYAKRGRAVFAVHTGMIVYPMMDFLALVHDTPDVLPSDSEHYEEIQTQALEALAFHDRQWRDGPGDDEGHYVGLDQEDILEGKVLPGNRLSAMGRALWAAWKVTGDTAYRDRALKIGRYIKGRLGVGTDGAYYWEYWLPDQRVSGTVNRKDVNGEDASHGELTASFPFMLAAEGEVFGDEDMRRFGLTVVNGLARLGDGILFGNVTGDPGSNPALASSPHEWLIPGKAAPEAKDRLVAFYLNYQPSPGPLDLARLMEYAGEKK